MSEFVYRVDPTLEDHLFSEKTKQEITKIGSLCKNGRICLNVWVSFDFLPFSLRTTFFGTAHSLFRQGSLSRQGTLPTESGIWYGRWGEFGKKDTYSQYNISIELSPSETKKVEIYHLTPI